MARSFRGFLVLCLIALPAFAWWEAGHQAIARIAAAHLDPAARARIANLLEAPDNPNAVADALARISTWADETRQETKTSEWHYTDLTLQDSKADLPLRCKDDNCATARIELFASQLAGKRPGGRWSDRDALRFLVHLVGDIHQPLHAVSNADLGGNCEVLDPPIGKARNLHALWDGELVHAIEPNDQGLASTIEGEIDAMPADERREAESGTAADWTWASHELAIRDIYQRLQIPSEPVKFPANCTGAPEAIAKLQLHIQPAYLDEMKPVVRSQIAKAGLRLARVLNESFGRASAKRYLNLEDLNRLREVEDPQVSPDGHWVAYTVRSVDSEADKNVTHVWMSAWDGSETLQLTFDSESESSPRWSPDGKYLSFVSSRTGKAKGSQVWIMDRRGGEAHQLTDLKNLNLSQYDWAPDSKKLLLVLQEKEEPDADEAKPGAPPKPPKPIVIDRYHFKEDVAGYLSAKRNHIYLFNVESHKLDQITKDDFDETNARWSPDGKKIAFTSNQDKDPDRTENSDVFVVDPQPGGKARKLTNFPGPDLGRLAWSPDSKLIAYMQGIDPKYSAYQMEHLAVVPADGGAARVLTADFDRPVSEPAFTPDGSAILFIAADDRSAYPAKVSVSGGSVERMVGGSFVASTLSSKSGHTALLVSSDESPDEIFALDGGSLRKVTSQNDGVLGEMKLGATEDVTFQSPDGVEVHGLLTKPVGFEAGKKYPMLLRIHGGPNGQNGHAFSFENQFFAANGYLVLNVNYRGSSGRGEKFQQAIFADWGHKEVIDLLAGVDHVLQMGLADANRLGIGGWSYGGILTDYTIASDNRFKAAISGAGSANQISMYGIDQYVFQYDNELGPPWKNPEAWMKVSYPFFHADRIHTPTLFMGGDKDFNVPVVGGEQMYEALKALNVPTEMIIYPGEFHGFRRPSFIRDRYQRYLAWYDKYLKTSGS
jgi:dipeptidyl aminopeptidase/acylaminoacyl peptidase